MKVRKMIKTTFLTKEYVRNWRESRDMPRRELGIGMNYKDGEYVRKVELGMFPLTTRFARRFNAFKLQVQSHERREIKSRYPLPPHLKILARPKRCKVCKEWFVFPNASDNVCTSRTCRREYRKSN